MLFAYTTNISSMGSIVKKSYDIRCFDVTVVIFAFSGACLAYDSFGYYTYFMTESESELALLSSTTSIIAWVQSEASLSAFCLAYYLIIFINIDTETGPHLFPLSRRVLAPRTWLKRWHHSETFRTSPYRSTPCKIPTTTVVSELTCDRKCKT